MIWKVRGKFVPLDRPLLMGVLNLTPDSFSDGGVDADIEASLCRAAQMVADGADILDLGGESTRPGAPNVSVREELDRIFPVLEKLADKTTALISIDTTKPEIAKACLARGAHIINDVSGLRYSGEMAQVVKDFGAGLVIMHSRGNPETMQQMTDYSDVVKEVMAELRKSIEKALQAGLPKDSLVMDPGLGFAKTVEQNFEILKRLEEFHPMGYPVLVGPSRKSFIGKATGREVSAREFGTAACVTTAVLKGARILRVHDVRAMRDVIRTTESIQGEH